MSLLSPTVRGGRRRRFLAVVAAAAVALVVGGTVLAVPASAAPATGALTVNKTVDQQNSVSLSPGDEFTYQIAVGCDDNDCAASQMTDRLPAQFQGFSILRTSTAPAGRPSSTSYSGCTTTVTASCVLTVDYREALGAGGTGIAAGDTYTTTITLQVPATLPATWPSNGTAVVNTAAATSTTATGAQDTADVTVNIPVSVAAALGKTWTPASQQFAPGASSTITLTPRNTSNVAADSVVVQDPTSATAAAATLGSDDPFALVDFTGFGPVTLPEGATTVQVDAYAPTGGGYDWVPGQPRAPADIALPDGVAPASVAGLRFTFRGPDGAAITPGGAAGSIPILVAQRDTNRQTGTSLVGGAQVVNDATATVAAQGRSASVRATAPYAITGLNTAVTATKTIAPAQIPAGTTATATISGKNTSNGPLSALSVADTAYFTRDIAFGGFTGGLAYPTGATAGEVVWTFSDGTTTRVAFADGATPTTPTPPAGAFVSGFSLDYTGAVAVGASASAQYLIAPTVDSVSQAQGSVGTTNTVDVTGTNAAGSSSDSASAPLRVFYPTISLGIAKSISPQSAVAPGGTVVAQLPTTTAARTSFVRPTRIVVTDVTGTGPGPDFWNAFDPTAIAPTQVPAGSTLLVEYTPDGGATWKTLDTADATAGTIVYRSDIPAALRGTITGLRFTFAKPDGFAQGITVSPNTVYQARSQLRDGSGPTSVADASPSGYVNEGSAQGTGAVDGLPAVQSPVVRDDANASIQTSTGTGTLLASKAWTDTAFSRDVTTLDSQSGEQAGTRLGWGVNSTGYSSLTVTDSAAGQGDPSQTVFQAFNLLRIAPVAFTADPLLRWDRVTKVELYQAGAWTTVPAPAGSWMSAAGFTGYTLSGAQSAAATGVRITVEPNDAARAASTDPLAPPVGSGIATSSAGGGRSFGLVWQLRNVVRVLTGPSQWVTATHGYNDPDPATIVNTVGVAGVQDGTAVGPRTASDTVSLIDQPPLVGVTKTSQKSSIVVPQPGDVAPSGYPTNDFTVVARNQSASKASYLRVSDPMPCDASATAACLTTASGFGQNPYDGAAYSAATNPFERFTITGIDFSGIVVGRIDGAASAVTLWHRDAAGALSTSQLSVTAADALPASALQDVVGVSVLYQGSDPATTGGTITTSPVTMVLHTQVRSTLRSDPSTFVTPFTVANRTFAQSYDPVLYPSGAQSTPSDTSAATVALTQGRLDVTASKSFAPTSILEARAASTPVAVTLGATQGPKASVPTSQVTITDADQRFWSTFRLTSLAASDVTLPAGSDRVRVDVQTNGTTTWQQGTAGPTAVLPAVDPATVTGIRFVFDRADQGLLSNTAVPAPWTAKAVLHVAVLSDVRGTTTPVAYTSNTIDDTIQTLSHRYTESDLYPDAASAATAGILLDPGVFRLQVTKSPENDQHTVVPGDPNPWTLTFRNAGTGLLTIAGLVDTLPTSLEWDGTTPTYADSAGGTLPTTGVTTAYDAGSRTLRFDWPAGSQTLQPGETFTVTLGIVLQPGLLSGQRATNQMVVQTAQTLASCTNPSGNGQGTVAGLPATDCGTTNYVSPQPGPALFATKGVQGDVDGTTVSGAVNPANPATSCITDAQGYYGAPCAANTVVGGTDRWKLATANSGTVAYTSLTLVDPLPAPGDRLLATGNPRGGTGSAWRPVFDIASGMDIQAPAGTTVTWQVTTSANVCVVAAPGSWSSTDPTCSAATWVDHRSYTGDGSDITGLRVILDFTTSPAKQLAPGGTVQATFQTIDTPTATAGDRLAPVSTPVAAGTIAWNQFGAVASTTSGVAIQPRAPAAVGVTLGGGPLQITKSVTGAASSAAPTSFQADVACTVAGAAVDLGPGATVTLDASNAYTATILGIPLGASCVTTEAGALGAYGEAARSISPETARVIAPGTADTVPAGQLVTITNRYDFGSLSLEKTARRAGVQVGRDITYDLTVTNTGGITATAFSVSDELPVGATFVSASGDGALQGDVVTWPIATLAPGDSTTVTITLAYPVAGSYTNRATVTPPRGPAPFARTRIVDPCAAGSSSACAAVAVTLLPPGGIPPGTTPPGGTPPAGGGVGPAGGTGTGAGSSTALGGVLAFTGSNPGEVGIAAGAALLAGLGILLASRRRRRS